MLFQDTARHVLAELERTLLSIADADVERFVDALLSADRVFLAGAGRSGLVVRAFAMRLMHLGLPVFVVGEIVTPGLRRGDLLVLGSGSGETGSLVVMAEKAKALGAGVALVTIAPDSRLGRLADVSLRIPAPTPKNESTLGHASVQPMGALFEQSMLLVLDIIVMRAMARRDLSAAEMFGRHANLE